MHKFYSFILTGIIGFCFTPAAFAERLVETIRFADIAETRTLQFPARVINLQLASIAAEASARITAFPLQVGDVIEQGKLLVELDCKTPQINQTRIRAAIKQLLARRKLTEQQLDRARRLSTSSSISRDELDQRQTQLDADNASIEEQEANLEAAKQSVDQCKIKAPFSGMLVEKLSTTGSYASPGVVLLKLLKTDAVEVELEIPANQIAALQQAKRIVFHSQATTYPLNIRSIIPLVNSNTLQQLVRLSLQSPALPPGGSFGLVRFDAPELYLPAAYVQKRDGDFGVFSAQNGKAVFTRLVGAEEAQAVATSLPAETLIISSQLQLLQHQETISLRP
ncbi:MAG: efflux RND transporter periplasmic adaptor subunit [Gammaproteobacteria bacterium]|nr:efflux RND transporter periplasmic adaptor subunit [Gammaproteobacteria bacterium]